MSSRAIRTRTAPGPRRRWRTASLAVLALVAAGLAPVLAGAPVAAAEPAPTFEQPYLDGHSGPEPTRSVSLAGTWTFTPIKDSVCAGASPFNPTGPLTCVDSPATEAPTTIQVPGGGWLKQGWTKLSVAEYSRTVRVPSIKGPQTTRVAFGAVNHRATLYVDGRKVGTQVTAYTPSVFDITRYVTPGRSHDLRVLVEGRKALVGPDGRYTVPEGASWSDDVAQGIFRSANLEVYPAVRISDTVVRTSVQDRTFTYDVEVSNATAKAQKVRLSGGLDSWNGAKWTYPGIPSTTVTVPANSTRTVTVGPLRWRAGAESYWWPNLPYAAGYRAQLHDLTLTASTPGQKISDSTSRTRFGFRESRQVGDHYELNGHRINFRGDSLQGANYDNIDHHGRSDAYDTLPGFLKPSAGNGGWPKAVDNYQRLNFNVVRIHQLPGTPYMLDVADEKGLMIIDEPGIRGSNNRQNFVTGLDNMVKGLGDLVRRDRNHASVVRWSQSNEPVVGYTDNPGAGPGFDETLYRTVMALDTTRPISTDSAVDGTGDLPHDNYSVFCHYADGVYPAPYTESICAGPVGKPQGQTEFVWPGDNTAQGAVWFSTGSLRMRAKGASDVRPYTLPDLWAAVVPGVKTSDMVIEWFYPWGQQRPLYGEDNLSDPWSNHHIQLIQRAFNPVAAVDTEFWDANKLSDTTGQWPTAPGQLFAGSTTRAMTVFNDTLAGTRLDVVWRLRTGSAGGAVVDQGRIRRDIPLGTSAQVPVTFTVPTTDQPLFLELQVSKPGEGVLFRDTSTVYSTS